MASSLLVRCSLEGTSALSLLEAPQTTEAVVVSAVNTDRRRSGRADQVSSSLVSLTRTPTTNGIPAPTNWTENAGLSALRHLGLLDTVPTEAFDRITRLASQIFDLPLAAVSLTDSDRQRFKSRVGIDQSFIPRDKAPCAQVAESSRSPMVPDLMLDPCYRDSPLAGAGVRSMQVCR